MFCSRTTHGIMKYFLICVITLSLECLASTETVKEENKRIPNITTRSLHAGERDTLTFPTTSPRLSNINRILDDRDIFFMVLGIGIVIVGSLSVYYFKMGKRSTTPDSFAGATIHRPPGNWIPSSATGDLQNLPPQEFHSYHNAAFVGSNLNMNHLRAGIHEVDSNPMDHPPAYSAIVLSDLGSHPEGVTFPSVRKADETPPPVYENGYSLK